MDATKIPILLVEDDPNDVFFMTLAMQKAGMVNPLQVVKDGRQALSYLRGVGIYSDREQYSLPCLVLLDLRLPQMPGFEVLRWIRERAQFRNLIVIVFTSSNLEVDVEQAYRLGANAYIAKPSNPAELFETVRALKEFWLRATLLPPERFDTGQFRQPSFRFEFVA